MGLSSGSGLEQTVGDDRAERKRRVLRVVPAAEWDAYEPLIAEIDALKRQRGAVILAHNYQTPEIFHGIADITGDSLALAREAARSDAEVIVVCGVAFMAETAKLLNPDRTVLLPAPDAGCSLADSITVDDVLALRAQYPGVPVVTYVNTSAAVKAVSDVCCTSGNAVEIVESLGSDRVIFLPDEYLGRHVASQTAVEIILWQGHCEVHERFTPGDIHQYRADVSGLTVLAHPECPPDVLAVSDYVGSTAGMIDYVATRRPAEVLLVTECSMSDNVAIAFPDVNFVRPCNLCPHMKRVTLAKVRDVLRDGRPEVEVDAAILAPARRAIERMLELSSSLAVTGTAR
jgi:quinolinate synthase